MNRFVFHAFAVIFLFVVLPLYAQEVPVTLAAGDSTLDGVLDQIEKQTDYRFVVNPEVNLNTPIRIQKVEARPLGVVLVEILRGTDIEHSVRGLNITLSLRPAETPRRVTITGRVSDSRGQRRVPRHRQRRATHIRRNTTAHSAPCGKRTCSGQHEAPFQ